MDRHRELFPDLFDTCEFQESHVFLSARKKVLYQDQIAFLPYYSFYSIPVFSPSGEIISFDTRAEAVRSATASIIEQDTEYLDAVSPLNGEDVEETIFKLMP